MAIKFGKLSKQQQQYLAGGALLTAVGGFFYVKTFWMPTAARIQKARESITAVSAKIEEAVRAGARRPQLEAELEALTDQATAVAQQLPKDKFVPDILVTVMKIAKRTNVSVLGFTPGPVRSEAFFMELQYPLRVKGTCHNIGRFLAGLAVEERIFNAMNVVFGAAAPGTGAMEVNFTLLSYQYKQ